MNRYFLLQIAIISCAIFSCAKSPVQNTAGPENLIRLQEDQEVTYRLSTIAAPQYVTYLIAEGQQYSNQRAFETVSLTEMNFCAKFNQSAIYQTIIPGNQYDINKLWGFSEGYNNQYNSARIGWGYSNGAIRLYGYVYSKGDRHYKEITTILPSQEASCSIKISGTSYIIAVNGISVTLPRGATGKTAIGLQQYPYFGGDEMAPHDITIVIKKS